MKRFICFAKPTLIDGDEAIIVVPTYSMYAIYAKATGAEVIRVRRRRRFQFPAHSVLNAITPRHASDRHRQSKQSHGQCGIKR